MIPGAKLGVGLLGCGAFGRFCVREFTAMPGLRAAAVADTIPEAARKTGEEFAVPVCADIHALAARRMIDAARTARRFLAVNLIMKLSAHRANETP
jgi:predicted dehydrogenase